MIILETLFQAPKLIHEGILDMLTTPREYQSTNAERLANSPLGLLLMDMGTGKSLTVLLTLHQKYQENPKTTTIVTMPNSIQTNFRQEITKHFGSFFRVNYITKPKHRVRQGCLNLIPFSIIGRFRDEEVDILVVDEAHVARNKKTNIYGHLCTLSEQTTYTWLLTGTPIVNYKSDLRSLLSLKDEDCTVLTTIKSEVLDLPKIEYIKHRVKNHLVKEYKTDYTLSQITEDRVQSSLNTEKWDIIKEAKGNKLVFVSFKQALRELMVFLGTKLTVNGDMCMTERYEHIDRFQTDGGTIVCTYDAAGVGINLTKADHVFCVDPAWNPAKISQAIDRVHRYGLDHPLQVHFLQQPNERWIYGLVGRKQNIIVDQLQIKERLPVKEDIEETRTGQQSIRPIKPVMTRPVKPKIRIRAVK